MSITLDESHVASAAMHVAKQLGYPEMKDLQVKVVVDFVCGRDVFAVLPTGYGKSLCYACLPGVFAQVLCRYLVFHYRCKWCNNTKKLCMDFHYNVQDQIRLEDKRSTGFCRILLVARQKHLFHKRSPSFISG